MIFLKIHPDLLPFKSLNYLSKAIVKNPLPNDPTIWDILDDCRNGEGEIYQISQSDGEIVGVFYIEIYPNIMNIALLGGENVKEWRDQFLAFINSLMKERGIRHLSVVGRQGWSKIFKELKPIGTLYLYEN